MPKITIAIESEMSMDEALAIVNNLTGMGEDYVVQVPQVTTQTIAPVVNDPAPMAEPAPTPTPEPTTEYGGELDANGTPWIDGIHATTKNKTKAGVWSRRRGVDKKEAADAEVAARAKLAGAPTPATPVAGLPGAAPAEPEPTVESVAPVSMDELAIVYSEASSLGLVTGEQVMAMYTKHGCETVDQIATNETARAGVANELRAIIDVASNAGAGGLPGA